MQYEEVVNLTLTRFIDPFYLNSGFVDSIGIMIDRLKSDLLYAQEYRQFAEAMSYADDDQQITFDRAILSLERIASYVSD